MILVAAATGKVGASEILGRSVPHALIDVFDPASLRAAFAGASKLFLAAPLVPLTDTVADVTGRAPRAFAGWARENVRAFARAA